MQEKNNSLGFIVKRFLRPLLQEHGLSCGQFKVLRALSDCRTTGLGGSAMVCNDCGQVHYVLHSCRNRHCPQCQGIDKELWIQARKQDLLPVKYYHVVFTVPHHLHELFRFNRKPMYDLLFEKAWETIKGFAANPAFLGAMAGAIGILHTRDQQMNYHPHVHFIVPAGGIDKEWKWKHSKQDGKFLFDVKEMSKVFSAKFAKKLRRLKRQGEINKQVPRELIPKPWVVYAKQAFSSPETVLEYLARYTHRVAISNARIIKVTGTHVTFSWCNRKKGYKKEHKTISGTEFLKLFLEHIVPPHFRRIRHYGFLSTRNKSACIEKIRHDLGVEHSRQPLQLTRAEVLKAMFGERSTLCCKACGGELVLFEVYPGKRAPPIEMNKGLSPAS